MNEIGAPVAAVGEHRQTEPAKPYPGLRPFRFQEASIFFGREQMTDEVLVRLNERHMVVVHGASGCGKSSLVAAGVLPQLRARRERRGLRLRVRSFRPGTRPMQELVDAIAAACELEPGAIGREQIYRAIAGQAGPRPELARLAAGRGIDQVCIVVDQFEELFRFAELESFEEARRFAEVLVALAGAVNEPPKWWEDDQPGAVARPAVAEAEISFLLTMRSEFLGECARYTGLAEAINQTQYLLPNMARSDLIRAIREPAEVFGGTVDHGFAERITEDATRESDSLPLVQHALMQLWASEDDQHLTIADYDKALAECGQSDDLRHRSPLGAILAGHADRVLEGVTKGDPEQLEAAAFIFRGLSRIDSEGRVTRCPQRVARLEKISGVSSGRTREIIDAFRAEGVSFLTPYATVKPELDGNDMIDISHEALIRTWPRMSDQSVDPEEIEAVGWIDREAQEALLWRWLSVQAREYQRNRSAYLDPITSERVGKWFATISKRPEWARPHLVWRTKPDSDRSERSVQEEPEWQAVERLVRESSHWIGARIRRYHRLLMAAGLLLTALGVLSLGLLYSQLMAMRDAAAVRATTSSVAKEAVGEAAAVKYITEANLERPAGATEATEEVTEMVANAARAARADGVVLVADETVGYIWVGHIARGGSWKSKISKRTRQGRPEKPDQLQVDGRYTITDNIIVRNGYPAAGNIPASGIGIITAGAELKALERPWPVRVEGGTDYWLKAQLKFDALPVVHLHYANDASNNAAVVGKRLQDLGYRVGTELSASASGLSQVTYCDPADEKKARRLAGTTTLRLAELGHSSVVAAAQKECTAKHPPGQLQLWIDFGTDTTTSQSRNLEEPAKG